MNTSRPPRMDVVDRILEAALDAGNPEVVAACRRLRRAHLRGWRRHHDPADMELVLHVEALIDGRA